MRPTSISNKEKPLLPLYYRFINDSKTGKRLQPNGRRISEGTITNYYHACKLLEKFCAQKAFYLRIKPIRYLNSRELIVEKNYWKKFYRKFTDYLYSDCSHFDNYAGHTIKNVKVFFNYLNKELGIVTGDFYKSFYVRKEEIAIHPLMPEELNFLICDTLFENSLSRKMREVKDFFVFGCTVALRVSDLLRLKKTNIRITNQQYYLAVRSVKTSTDTLIKLPEYAVKIVKRYKAHKMLLPAFSKPGLNKYIKLLLEQARFTTPVLKTRERRGQCIEFIKGKKSKGRVLRFCDVASTHTMRRTAITTMLSLGMSEQVVRKISGHAPGSKEFYRYVLWAQTYQDQETENAFKKLMERKLEKPLYKELYFL